VTTGDTRFVLEQIILVNDVVKMPLCFGGERRCPPEDVGGVHGYQEVLEAIFDPRQRKTTKQFVRWAGGHVIDEFDLKAGE